MNEVQYPRLAELKVPVYTEPVSHVFAKDLNVALGSPKKIKEFHQLFGIQTCPGIGNRAALYPWDVEAVLERMFSGKLTGTQLHWD